MKAWRLLGCFQPPGQDAVGDWEQMGARMWVWKTSRGVILVPKAREHSGWDGVGNEQGREKTPDMVGREQRRLMPWQPLWWPQSQLVMGWD